MVQPVIIGLTGPARSGKDETANIISKFYGGIQRVQIAGPLKAFCREVFDWTEEHTDGALKDVPDPQYPRPCVECNRDNKGENPGHLNKVISVGCWTCDTSGWYPCVTCEGKGTTYLTPRQAMQRLGDDWSTPLYEPIWALKAARTAAKLAKSGLSYHPVVVTDCRFIRDISAIRDVGGIIVQIHRGETGLTGAASQHRGEVERNSPEFQALVHHHIYNDGTLVDLQDRVATLVTRSWFPEE